jgi:hypothetical protein
LKKISPKKRIIQLTSALLGLIIFSIVLAPLVIIIAATGGHVNYLGYTTDEYPMQGLYTPDEFGLTANDQFLTTQDGFKIWVSEISTNQPKGIVIFLSGIQQPSVTYFYGHSKWLQKNGFASVLLEVRGHGQSDGGRICLGYEEVADVQAVMDDIKSRPEYDGVPIILYGVSMGGAIAINAFGQIGDIDGLIAMSAYTSFADVVYDTMHGYGVPSFLCSAEKSLTDLYMPLFFKEAPELTPIKQIQNIGERPAFFIACSGDDEVLPKNTQRLLSAAPAHCDSWIKDSWEHFIVNGCDFINVEQDKEYCRRILLFLDKVAAEKHPY